MKHKIFQFRFLGLNRHSAYSERPRDNDPTDPLTSCPYEDLDIFEGGALVRGRGAKLIVYLPLSQQNL